MLICLLLLLLIPISAQAQTPADVRVHPTRTIKVLAEGSGVAQVCAVSPAATTVPLVCVGADEAAVDQEVQIDVTTQMTPGVKTCFRAVSLSPEGLMSEPSLNQACGTLPKRPVLR